MNFICYLKDSKKSGSTSLTMLTFYESQFSDGRFAYSTKEHIDPENWIPPVKGVKGSSGKAKKG
jgi:hypothetical protein